MNNPNRYFMRASCTVEGPEKVYKDFREVGILNFNEDGSVIGSFLGDWVQQLRGTINGNWVRGDRGDLRVSLLKRSMSSPEVVYFLGKGDGKNSVEGTYKGYWRYANEDRSVRKTRARMVIMALDSKVSQHQ